jgi:hypothetical protein
MAIVTRPQTAGADGLEPPGDLRRPARVTTGRTAEVADRISVTSWAAKLPMENPNWSTWPNSRAAMNAIASRAICSTVLAVVPVEPPTPA